MRYPRFQAFGRLAAGPALAVAALSVLAFAPATGARVAGKPSLTWSVPVFSPKPPFDAFPPDAKFGRGILATKSV